MRVVTWVWIVFTALVVAGAGVWLFRTPTLHPYLELVNYLLAVAGFLVLWVQVHRALTAAQAAKAATQGAFQMMSERVTIADISRIRGKFGHVQDSLRAGRFETALHHIQDLRAELTQVRARRGFDDDRHQTQIQDMVATLSRFQDTLERKLGDAAGVDVPVPRFNQKLGESTLAL